MTGGFVGDAATVLLYGSAIPAVLFVVLYAARSPWWVTRIGRAMMVISVGHAIVLTIGSLFWLLGETYPARDWVRLFAMTWTFFGSWGLLVELWRAQRVPEVPPGDPVTRAVVGR